MIRCWALALVFSACGSNHEQSPGPDAPVGCTVDSDCDAGMKCNDLHECIGGCGGDTLDLTYVPPSFIVVLDRSCSMDKIPTGATQTKWKSAVDALDHVLTTHGSDIDWGITLFPDTTGATCAQDAIPIPIGHGTAPAIQTLLTNALQPTDPLFPDSPCVTNIDTGLQQAALDPGLVDHKSYVMLVTDGAQSACTDGGGVPGSETAITDLFTSRGIKTFVVGFGGGVDAAQMNKFAMLGGAPLTGATKYYKADTANQLDQVFQSIAELVVSCEYTVDPAPPDVDQTYVYFTNNELVPRDPTHVAGWDYDPATMKLTFYGSHCDRLQTHAVTDVDVVYGCPIAPPL
jgi:hypothetical protein